MPQAGADRRCLWPRAAPLGACRARARDRRGRRRHGLGRLSVRDHLAAVRDHDDRGARQPTTSRPMQIARRPARPARRQRVRDEPRRPRRASCAPSPWIAEADAHRDPAAHDRHRRPRARRRRRSSSSAGSTSSTTTGHPFKRARLEPRRRRPAGHHRPRPRDVHRRSRRRPPRQSAPRSPRSRPGATSRPRPPIGEVHLDPHGALTLAHLRAGDRDPARRAPTPTSPPACRRSTRRGPSSATPSAARARAIHLDARPDHVTVAFAKDRK